MSSSRPASMRVLHQAPPPVATRLTRSPSRTPFFRNSATATLARWAWNGVRWMSSNDHEERPAGVGRRSVFVETRGRGTASLGASAGTWTASKLGDRLGFAVLGHDEVFLAQAGDGLPPSCRDHHVDGDDLDLRREHRNLGRNRFGCLGRGGTRGWVRRALGKRGLLAESAAGGEDHKGGDQDSWISRAHRLDCGRRPPTVSSGPAAVTPAAGRPGDRGGWRAGRGGAWRGEPRRP